MKTKRKVALFCIIVMMLSLFSGCQQGKTYTDESGNVIPIGPIANSPVDTYVEDPADTSATSGGDSSAQTSGSDTGSNTSSNTGSNTTVINTSSGNTSSNGYTPPSDDLKRINVMSFNVLSWDDANMFDPPSQRFLYALDVIKNYDPDIIGMQEVCQKYTSEATFDWNASLKDALEAKGDYKGRAIIEEEEFEHRNMQIGNGLVIYYKKDRFELKDSGCYRYTDKLSARYYQWVKLYDKKYNRNVVFTNTHWAIDSDSPSRDEVGGNNVRKEQAEQLYDFWKQNVTGNTALFCTGDFNTLASSAAIQHLMSSGLYLPSCEVALSGEGIASNTIDFCFVSTKSLEVDSYFTIQDTYEHMSPNKGTKPSRYYQPSDHFPIMTEAYYK